MSDILKFSEAASKEDKLQEIVDKLDELKEALTDVIYEYEEDDGEEDTTFALSEALDDLEAVCDSINEVIADAL